MSAPIVDGVFGIVDRVGGWGHTAAGASADRKDDNNWNGTKWVDVFNSTHAVVNVTTDSAHTRLGKLLKTRKKEVKGADSLAAVVVPTVTGSNVAYDTTDTIADASARSTNAGTYHWDSNPASDRTSGFGHTNGNPHD